MKINQYIELNINKSEKIFRFMIKLNLKKKINKNKKEFHHK